MNSQMLFPYEEFVKFFQYEVYDLSPRGLINCGNRYHLEFCCYFVYKSYKDGGTKMY